jgi:hypothetical protein
MLAQGQEHRFPASEMQKRQVHITHRGIGQQQQHHRSSMDRGGCKTPHNMLPLLQAASNAEALVSGLSTMSYAFLMVATT